MSAFYRLLTFSIVFALAFAVSPNTRAQNSGPDPNDPVAFPTPNDEPDNGRDEFDLAAMTLDSTSMPSGFFFAFEGYTSAEQYDDNTVGGVDADELIGDGFISYYDSWYFSNDGSYIKTFASSFESVKGLKDAFGMLEDEEKLHPNGDLEDSDPLDGVGELPAETTSGSIENGDGTQSNYYDVSFRIDRLYLGVVMETPIDSEIDKGQVDDLAEQLADRATSVVNGDEVSGVVYGLSDLMVFPDPADGLYYNGYETAGDSFVLGSADEITDGLVADYETGTRLTILITTLYPFLTLSVAEFESEDDIANALEDPESLLYPFDDLEAIDSIDVDDADSFAAVAFTSSSDADGQDSVRIFAQVGTYLITVDAQGLDSLDEASDVAVEYVDALVSCVSGKSCDPP